MLSEDDFRGVEGEMEKCEGCWSEQVSNKKENAWCVLAHWMTIARIDNKKVEH